MVVVFALTFAWFEFGWHIKRVFLEKEEEIVMLEGLHLVNYLWSIAWDLRAAELERENFQCITQFWSACQPSAAEQQREEYLGTTTTEMLSKRRGGNCITTTNIFTGPITQKPSGQEKCIQRHVTHCLKKHCKMSQTISNIPTLKEKIGMKQFEFWNVKTRIAHFAQNKKSLKLIIGSKASEVSEARSDDFFGTCKYWK